MRSSFLERLLPSVFDVDSKPYDDVFISMALVSAVTIIMLWNVPHVYKECFSRESRRAHWCPGIILCIPLLIVRTFGSPYFWWKERRNKTGSECHSYDRDPTHIHHFYNAGSTATSTNSKSSGAAPTTNSSASNKPQSAKGRQVSNASAGPNANLQAMSST
jgi:hypothetical protein